MEAAEEVAMTVALWIACGEGRERLYHPPRLLLTLCCTSSYRRCQMLKIDEDDPEPVTAPPTSIINSTYRVVSYAVPVFLCCLLLLCVARCI